MITKTKGLFAVAVVLFTLVGSTAVAQLAPTPKPAPAPARWHGVIGEYGPDDNILIIYETGGHLSALFNRKEGYPIAELVVNPPKFVQVINGPANELIFTRDAKGRATQVRIGDTILQRRNIEPESGNQLHIKPFVRSPT